MMTPSTSLSGPICMAANDHQGALASFRASLRIKPISAHAPEWLVVVLNAQGSRPPLQNRRRPLRRK